MVGQGTHTAGLAVGLGNAHGRAVVGWETHTAARWWVGKRTWQGGDGQGTHMAGQWWAGNAHGGEAVERGNAHGGVSGGAGNAHGGEVAGLGNAHGGVSGGAGNARGGVSGEAGNVTHATSLPYPSTGA